MGPAMKSGPVSTTPGTVPQTPLTGPVFSRFRQELTISTETAETPREHRGNLAETHPSKTGTVQRKQGQVRDKRKRQLSLGFTCSDLQKHQDRDSRDSNML